MQLPDTKNYQSIAVISIAGQMIVLALAFLFHFVMGRMLGVSSYGDLGVILGIYTVVMVPVASIQAILMREVAKLHKEGKELELNWLVKKYFIRSVIFGIPLILLIGAGLYISGVVEPIATALILLSVPLFYGVFIFNTYFQGKQMPWHYSAIVVVIEGFRLALSILLVHLGHALLGVAFAYVLNGILLYLIGFVFLKNKTEKPFNFTMKTDLSYVLPTNVIFSLFMVTDLFFVRYLLGAQDAGLYNSASVLARAIFYANIGLMSAFLPQSSKLDLLQDKVRVKQIVIISVGILAAIAIGLTLFKEIFLGVLYGKEYLGAAPLLGILSISLFFLTVSVLLTNLLWSQREQKTPLVASGAAYLLFVVLLYVMIPVSGATGAVQASIISTACLLLFSAFMVWRKL